MASAASPYVNVMAGSRTPAYGQPQGYMAGVMPGQVPGMQFMNPNLPPGARPPFPPPNMPYQQMNNFQGGFPPRP